jgi:nicotinate-nucleotide adenylyltransferase
MKRKGISYTFDTLLEFEKKYPDASFFLILGKDAFEGLDSWQHSAEIKRKSRFLVADRECQEERVPEGPLVEWIRMPLCPISASEVRESIKQGRRVEDFLSPQVFRYILENRLYGKS